jgi:putative PIN family toxin of toxin-antitoxin system
VAETRRVVVDPNVLVSAAIAGGNPQRLVELATIGALQFLACPLLLDELEAVLARDRFLRWRTREELNRFVADVRQLAEFHSDPAEVPATTRDPNDDYLVAFAVEVAADVLCSGDADLLAVTHVVVKAPAALVRETLEGL